jgi:phospholipid/cholesterol/gamma-HCH transport system substrate-binding protein
MNNKVNYTLIGISVIVGIFMMFGFAYWMLKPTNDEVTQKYLIYFNESVLGLNIDAPVKYRGIRVGKVTRLRINPKNTEQVEVTVDILKTTPIKENTVAKLTAQGITGLTYINLTQGKNDAPALKPKEGEEYPVIKTVPSFFENLEQSFGNVSAELAATLHKTNRLLDNENQKQITRLLTRSANVMQRFERMLDNRTIEHFHATMQNLDRTTKQLDMLMPKIDNFIQKSVEWESGIDDSFSSIKDTYVSMDKTMDDMADSFAASAMTFEKMSYNINSVMLEGENVMIDLQNTLNGFQKSPSDFLYKKREVRLAPGER